MAKKGRKKLAGIGILAVIIGGLFSWACYNLLYDASGELLLSVGVENGYAQNGIIVIVAALVLYFVFKKTNLVKYL